MDGLCSLAVVVAQHAAEALPAPDITCIPANLVAGIDDPVPQALVIRLSDCLKAEGRSAPSSQDLDLAGLNYGTIKGLQLLEPQQSSQ